MWVNHFKMMWKKDHLKMIILKWSCISPFRRQIERCKVHYLNSEIHILCLNKIVLETAFTAIEGTKINTAR